tara:strand:- start:2849 stop:3067 length:219 start_codon:yes stop_codon:yes gene_type:complete
VVDREKIIEQLKKDYQHIFSTDEGKRILSDLQRRCFFTTSTFVPDNANETFVREGQRSVVLHIINMITKKDK